MSRYLVTGGAGAVGSNLVRALAKAGHQVSVLDDLSSGRAALLPQGVPLLVGSVDDPAALDEAFSIKPDYVLHLAALFANQNSVEHPERDLDVNGLGTLRVLEWARDVGVRKVLYCSSSCVYGAADEAREDQTLGEPETPYAMTKLLGEHYARFFARHHGLDTVIVRLFNVYGPHEHPGRYRNVIPNFISLARRGTPLPITGTGTETRDFTFVEDAVRGMLAALGAATPPGEVYNLASGRETAVLDLAERINALVGNEAGIEFAPRRAWDRTSRRLGRIDKAAGAFGYAPATDLGEGLLRTIEWLESVDA